MRRYGKRRLFFGLTIVCSVVFLITHKKRNEEPTYMNSGVNSMNGNRPHEFTEHDRLLPVANRKHKFYVYSAYYDARQAPVHGCLSCGITAVIRVIGITLRQASVQVNCKYWHSNGNSQVIKGRIHIIEEHHFRKYSACFVLCAVRGAVPESVSVIAARPAKPGQDLANKLHVRNREPAELEEKIAVCVRPMFSKYDDVNQLIEFVETYRILGVTGKFIFYNFTIGPRVDCVLKKYAAEGLVDVLPFNLNDVSTAPTHQEIWSDGQMAGLNDCIYRYMNKFKFVLNTDVDEFMVPVKTKSLLDFLSDESKTHDGFKNTGSISFKNSFFPIEYKDDPDRSSAPIISLRKTVRDAKFWAHESRSKYIAVSPNVVEGGIHNVWEHLPGKTALKVGEDQAFVRHYRTCDNLEMYTICGNGAEHVTDKRMFAYRPELEQAFNFAVKSAKKACVF